MSTAVQQASATVIPFPRRLAAFANGENTLREVKQVRPAPAICSENWYHEEAIREAQGELKS